MTAAQSCGRKNGADGGRRQSRSQLDGASLVHRSILLGDWPPVACLRMRYPRMDIAAGAWTTTSLGKYSDCQGRLRRSRVLTPWALRGLRSSCRRPLRTAFALRTFRGYNDGRFPERISVLKRQFSN